MRVAYFTGGKSVPSVRFRLPMFDRLRDRGHRCDILHGWPARYDSFAWAGWRLSRRIEKAVRRQQVRALRNRRYDCVVLETGLFHSNDWSVELEIRELSKRFVYEIDDAIFLLFPEKAEALATCADHVIVANDNLSNWARPLNSNVSIVPTCVDEQIYTVKRNRPKLSNEPFVVGWVGSAGNVAMIETIQDPLRAFLVEREAKIVVLTAKAAFNSIELGDSVSWCDINRCDLIEQLHRFDVGIMPMPLNDRWMEYKGNAKMLQYMAVGLPTVATAVGFNCQLIQHGFNGLLALEPSQWLECLINLYDSATMRHDLGQNARHTILGQYTIASRIDQYESILEGDS